MNKISFHRDYKKNDLKIMGLFGKVKSIQEFIFEKNEKKLSTYYHFNEGGYIIHKKSIDSELSFTIENREYLGNELLSVEENVFNGDEIIETSKEFYNGNIVKEEYYEFENRIPIFSISDEYKKESKYNSEGFLIEISRTYSNGEVEIDVYSYNENRIQIKLGKYNLQGSCYYCNVESELIFNENGLITEENRGDERTIYLYRGNSLHVTKRIMNVFGETALFIDTYNNGRCIKTEYSTYANASRDYKFDLPDYSAVSYFSYEDDSHGNWIKKIESCKKEYVIFQRVFECYDR